jgi:hypothetical protein
VFGSTHSGLSGYSLELERAIRSKTQEGIYLVAYIARHARSGFIHGLEKAESFDGPNFSAFCNAKLLKTSNFWGDQGAKFVEGGAKLIPSYSFVSTKNF